MNIRKILKYPPYFYITKILIASKDYNLVKEHLKYLDDIYRLNSKVNIEINNNPSRA